MEQLINTEAYINKFWKETKTWHWKTFNRANVRDAKIGFIPYIQIGQIIQYVT